MSVTKVDHTNFKEKITDSKGTVILDFWAPWCGPCGMIAPIVEELSENMSDISFCKVNVDDESAIAAAYGIVSIPTLIKFKDGKNIDSHVGFAGKEILASWVEKEV